MRHNTIAASLVLLFATGSVTGAAAAEEALKQQIVGTWYFVSLVDTKKDGQRSEPFGPAPNGIAIFEPGGQYAIILARPGLAKFASGNRLTGTAEENKATAQGSLAHFGTYAVNEADHSIVLKASGSSYPNVVGADRKFTVTAISAEELKWDTEASTTGGKVETTFKRSK